MSNTNQLRNQRTGMVINRESKREDKQCEKVVCAINEALIAEFGITLDWKKSLSLTDTIHRVKNIYPDITFTTPQKKSNMRPDGGITCMVDKNGKLYPILISEVKNQGTNDIRQAEGKKKQAKGNAVERLGKNVIGFKTLMLGEEIFPFVCFGDGCDFEDGSTILDRVSTIAMFGELNKDNTLNIGPNKEFARGSYFFRAPYWTAGEMYDIMYNVAKTSINYYFNKYGKDNFV